MAERSTLVEQWSSRCKGEKASRLSRIFSENLTSKLVNDGGQELDILAKDR